MYTHNGTIAQTHREKIYAQNLEKKNAGKDKQKAT